MVSFLVQPNFNANLELIVKRSECLNGKRVRAANGQIQ